MTTQHSGHDGQDESKQPRDLPSDISDKAALLNEVEALLNSDSLSDEEQSARADVSLEQILDQLISDAETPDIHHLRVFSDLTRSDMAIVRRNWSAIPVERRRMTIRQLTQAAEEDLDLHLGRLLRVALDDEDAEVRHLAVAGLWEDLGSDLVGMYTQILEHDPVSDVRAEAAKALGAYILAGELDEIDGALAMRAEEALLDILHNPNESILVQSHALESIAYSGEIGVRYLIEDAYYSPYEEMRISALVAMGRSADVRWRGLVRAELQNPSAAMRAQAATACGELEVRGATEELFELFSDPEQSVRLATIFALGRIGGQEATDALEALTLDADTPEAEAATHALEEMAFYADDEAIPLLDETSEDLDDWENDDPWDDWYNVNDRDLGSYEE